MRGNQCPLPTSMHFIRAAARGNNYPVAVGGGS